MRCVADHLKAQVLLLVDEQERDLFGRSSFNRYYYATFLIVRAGFKRMGFMKNTEKIGHAQIPDMLSQTLVPAFKKGCIRATRIQDRESISVFSSGADAAKELASLMTDARGVRTAADYSPESPIVINNNGFSLLAVSVDSAKSWTNRAEMLLVPIEKAWAQHKNE